VLVVGICSCLGSFAREEEARPKTLASPVSRPLDPRVSDLHRKQADFASVVKFDRFLSVGPDRVARVQGQDVAPRGILFLGFERFEYETRFIIINYLSLTIRTLPK
jgi:hypothetical protein